MTVLPHQEFASECSNVAIGHICDIAPSAVFETMRVDLSELHTKTLDLQISPQGTSEEQRQYVRVREVEALAGVFESNPSTVCIKNMLARRAVIDALRLVFGTVILEVAGGTELKNVSSDYESSGDKLDMSILMETLECAQLVVEVATIRAEAGLILEQGRVSVTSNGGRIEAKSGVFRNFQLDISNIHLKSPELHVKNLVMTWGEAGFEMRADDVTSDVFEFITVGTTATLQGIQAEQLHVHDADWSIKGLLAASGRVHLVPETLTPDPNQVGESEQEVAVIGEEYKSEVPVFSWSMLDTLSGYFNVDLGVDVKVPVIQHRRAVHHFRVPIEEGRLNFRDLEHNLAMLEELLLDFSVRDDELVLELGVPFLPTRGHGKRLVKWALSSEEQPWAENHFVRLSTLAQPQIVVSQNSSPPKALPAPPENVDESSSQGDAPAGAYVPEVASTALATVTPHDPDSESALDKLAFNNIEVELAMAKAASPQEALLKTLEVGSLKVQGDVIHQSTGELERTGVHGSLTDVRFSLDDFPLAGRKFDLNKVEVEGESGFKAELENLKLLSCLIDLGRIRAKSIDFGTYAEGDVES